MSKHSMMVGEPITARPDPVLTDDKHRSTMSIGQILELVPKPRPFLFLWWSDPRSGMGMVTSGNGGLTEALDHIVSGVGLVEIDGINCCLLTISRKQWKTMPACALGLRRLSKIADPRTPMVIRDTSGGYSVVTSVGVVVSESAYSTDVPEGKHLCFSPGGNWRK